MENLAEQPKTKKVYQMKTEKYKVYRKEGNEWVSDDKSYKSFREILIDYPAYSKDKLYNLYENRTKSKYHNEIKIVDFRKSLESL
jgi:hypothetical protein